jgi:hypothetical protein
MHLRQVVLFEGRAVGLLVWTTCSRKLAGRETFISWDARTREKRFGWIVQISRFLLLPQLRPVNLASRTTKASMDKTLDLIPLAYRINKSLPRICRNT